jgi:hypothetical protein
MRWGAGGELQHLALKEQNEAANAKIDRRAKVYNQIGSKMDFKLP